MSDAQYIPPPPPPPALPPPPVVPPSAPQFDFAKPFTYVFEDPRWLQKILIGGLFYLASVVLVGLFFVLGYIARVTRNVIAGDPRPLPEWEDLGGFFNEGARLFGVLLVYFIPFIVLGVPAIIAMGIADSRHGGLQAFGSGMAGCLACISFPLSLAMMIFLPGSLLFAIVEQRFGAAFEFGRIWRFIREHVGNYLLAVVIYLVARFLGGFGVALLCIGVIFTGFWSFLITAHAFAQVYRLGMLRSK